MGTAFRYRLLRVLVASAIVGSVGGWAFKRPMVAYACDGYGDCSYSNNTPKALQKVGVGLAAGYTVLDVYRVLKHSTPSATAAGSILKRTQSLPSEFSEVAKLLKNAAPAENYDTDGPYTVLWPTDTALREALGAERVAFLQSPAGQSAAQALLKQWTLPWRYTLAQLRTLKTVRNLAGEPLSVTLDGDTLRVGGATLALSEYPTSNGWILPVSRLVAEE
ncbi:fasciclin domain-containing protein [Armatimonas rosea]|uniref:Putative surface protein with fasciclin (FAS1) repeats n=1 Tax=Armatimonas rosea TaxID=685828 RepID=A0A7W9SPN9_ARMRO|nr:fasciclin domain-containing protein [Armatimonas rosea]MBB6049709.1 putative surface protein with fasciclin (FAS1) repeats [Armatimonas rosea]